MSNQPETSVTPEVFLQDVQLATEGWSQKYGGILGVIDECAKLQEQLNQQSEAIAAIRVAAIHELLKSKSGVEVAGMLGVSKAAISKSLKRPVWKDAKW